MKCSMYTVYIFIIIYYVPRVLRSIIRRKSSHRPENSVSSKSCSIIIEHVKYEQLLIDENVSRFKSHIPRVQTQFLSSTKVYNS